MAVPDRLLVDAGPLIALFNRRDRWHREALALFGDHRGTLVTTWPVLAETGHFIGRRVPDLLDLAEAGRIEIIEAVAATGRIASLLRTYADLPMDLADATLVVAAELSGLTDVLTLDRHFHVYRVRGRTRFNVWSLSPESA